MFGVQKMIDKNTQIEQKFYTLLKNNDIEFDKNLRGVIAFFFSSDKHFSQKDIEHYIKEKNLEIDHSSIKKLLELLCDYGFAKKQQFEDGIVRYEHLHINDHHDHFICIRCHKIIEFHSPQLENQQLAEARSAGFHPFWHKMEIYGLCNECFGTSEGVSMPLTMMKPGTNIKITEILKCPADSDTHNMSLKKRLSKNVTYNSLNRHRFHGMRHRLQDIGLVPGTRANVISSHMGLIVLAVRGQRIAVGRGMSNRVMVEIDD